MNNVNQDVFNMLQKIKWNHNINRINEKIYNSVKTISPKVKSIRHFFSDGKNTNAAITTYVQRVILFHLVDCTIFGNYIDTTNIDNGYDFLFEKSQIEMKVSASSDKTSWTGASHSYKVPKHFLFHYQLDDNFGLIDRYAVFFLDLNDCIKTEWQGNQKHNSSFSKLAINKEDEDRVYKVCGDLKACQKYCKIIYKDVK